MNRKEHRHRITQQFILRLKVCETDVLDYLSIDFGPDFLFKVLAIGWLYISGYFQRDSGAFGDIDGEVSSL